MKNSPRFAMNTSLSQKNTKKDDQLLPVKQKNRSKNSKIQAPPVLTNNTEAFATVFGNNLSTAIESVQCVVDDETLQLASVMGNQFMLQYLEENDGDVQTKGDEQIQLDEEEVQTQNDEHIQFDEEEEIQAEIDESLQLEGEDEVQSKTDEQVQLDESAFGGSLVDETLQTDLDDLESKNLESSIQPRIEAVTPIEAPVIPTIAEMIQHELEDVQEPDEIQMQLEITQLLSATDDGTEDDPTQTKSRRSRLNVSEETTKKIRQRRGQGSPLSEDVREEMETAFGGEDFSEVRIHTDGAAAELNAELGARAFTNREDIHFKSGLFDTDSTTGKHLLAHELTHVVQQRSIPDLQSKLTDPSQRNYFEIEADRTADTVVRGGQVKGAGISQVVGAGGVQLEEVDDTAPVQGIDPEVVALVRQMRDELERENSPIWDPLNHELLDVVLASIVAMGYGEAVTAQVWRRQTPGNLPILRSHGFSDTGFVNPYADLDQDDPTVVRALLPALIFQYNPFPALGRERKVIGLPVTMLHEGNFSGMRFIKSENLSDSDNRELENKSNDFILERPYSEDDTISVLLDLRAGKLQANAHRLTIDEFNLMDETMVTSTGAIIEKMWISLPLSGGEEGHSEFYIDHLVLENITTRNESTWFSVGSIDLRGLRIDTSQIIGSIRDYNRIREFPDAIQDMMGLVNNSLSTLQNALAYTMSNFTPIDVMREDLLSKSIGITFDSAVFNNVVSPAFGDMLDADVRILTLGTTQIGVNIVNNLRSLKEVIKRGDNVDFENNISIDDYLGLSREQTAEVEELICELYELDPMNSTNRERIFELIDLLSFQININTELNYLERSGLAIDDGIGPTSVNMQINPDSGNFSFNFGQFFVPTFNISLPSGISIRNNGRGNGRSNTNVQGVQVTGNMDKENNLLVFNSIFIPQLSLDAIRIISDNANLAIPEHSHVIINNIYIYNSTLRIDSNGQPVLGQLTDGSTQIRTGVVDLGLDNAIRNGIEGVLFGVDISGDYSARLGSIVVDLLDGNKQTITMAGLEVSNDTLLRNINGGNINIPSILFANELFSAQSITLIRENEEISEFSLENVNFNRLFLSGVNLRIDRPDAGWSDWNNRDILLSGLSEFSGCLQGTLIARIQGDQIHISAPNGESSDIVLDSANIHVNANSFRDTFNVDPDQIQEQNITFGSRQPITLNLFGYTIELPIETRQDENGRYQNRVRLNTNSLNRGFADIVRNVLTRDERLNLLYEEFRDLKIATIGPENITFRITEQGGLFKVVVTIRLFGVNSDAAEIILGPGQARSGNVYIDLSSLIQNFDYEALPLVLEPHQINRNNMLLKQGLQHRLVSHETLDAAQNAINAVTGLTNFVGSFVQKRKVTVLMQRLKNTIDTDLAYFGRESNENLLLTLRMIASDRNYQSPDLDEIITNLTNEPENAEYISSAHQEVARFMGDLYIESQNILNQATTYLIQSILIEKGVGLTGENVNFRVNDFGGELSSLDIQVGGPDNQDRLAYANLGGLNLSGFNIENETGGAFSTTGIGVDNARVNLNDLIYVGNNRTETSISLGLTNARIHGPEIRIPRSETNTEEVIQPKLAIGTSNDVYEQEADSVANSVVSNISTSIDTTIQRGIAQTSTPIISKKVNENSSEVTHASSGLSNRITAAKGTGTPLSGGVKERMESSFGANFSDVRIHNDSNAVQMNEELQSHAFTVGNDIFFNQNKYQPENRSEDRLLAHELTHTIQQGNGGKQIQRALKFEIQTENRIWVVDSISGNVSRMPRKFGEFGPTEEGDIPAYITTGKYGSKAKKKGDVDFVEIKGDPVMKEDKKADPLKMAQFEKDYRFKKDVKSIKDENGEDSYDIIGKTVAEVGGIELMYQVDNRKEMEDSKLNLNRFEYRYLSKDGFEILDVHLDKKGRFKKGKKKFLKVGRKKPKHLKGKEAQFREIWIIREDPDKGQISYTHPVKGIEVMVSLEKVKEEKFEGPNIAPNTFEKFYWLAEKNKSKRVNVHLDDNRLKPGHVKFMEKQVSKGNFVEINKKKVDVGKEQTAMELQAESGGYIEFETPKWFKNWDDLRLRVQDAVDMTYKLSAADPATDLTSKQINQMETIKKNDPNIDKEDKGLGQMHKWPSDLISPLNTENLYVEITDYTWKGTFQTSEGIPLDQVGSILKDPLVDVYREAQYDEYGNIKRDNVGNKIYKEKELGSSAITIASKIFRTAKDNSVHFSMYDESIFNNLKGFLELIITYIMWGQINEYGGAKDTYQLMARTDFGSMHNALLSKKEKALFKEMVGVNAAECMILDNKLSKEITKNLEYFDSNFTETIDLKTNPLFLASRYHKLNEDTPNTSIYEWLISVTNGDDLLTGKNVANRAEAIGGKKVNEIPNKKDYKQALFEKRVGYNEPAINWVKYAKNKFDQAMSRTSDTPDDPSTPSTNEASKTSIKIRK